MDKSAMSQHTPGPWSIASRGGMNGREVRVGELVIATVNTTCNEQGNREANARLIAAAPEMLTLAKHAARQDLAPDVLQKRARALLDTLKEG